MKPDPQRSIFKKSQQCILSFRKACEQMHGLGMQASRKATPIVSTSNSTIKDLFGVAARPMLRPPFNQSPGCSEIASIKSWSRRSEFDQAALAVHRSASARASGRENRFHRECRGLRNRTPSPVPFFSNSMGCPPSRPNCWQFGLPAMTQKWAVAIRTRRPTTIGLP